MNTFEVEGTKVLGCPFCGGQPEIETLGTEIVIYCCASLSVPKYDELTLEELDTWNDDFCAYSPEIEKKLLALAVGYWNTRA